MNDPKLSTTVQKFNLDEDNQSIVSEFEKLSTSSQSSVQILLQNLAKGEAVLKRDKDGKQFIEYQERKVPCKKRTAHHSQANRIVKPKSDKDVQCKVEACLELIDFVKNGKNPAGVFLDSTKIHVKDSAYREDFEFTRTKQILGHGLYGGDIVVVKDNKTDQEHALKTIMISVFRKEEIQCWVDLSDSGYVPSLYLFKIKDNMVDVHMEILQNSLTMQSIIDEHLQKLDKSLLKPFSLYVLDGALEAVSTMHGKNWVHNDLHEGNMMLQQSDEQVLKLKIIDFGRASKYEDEETGLDFRGFRSDIRNILGMYCSVFGGSKIYDFHMADWEADIGNQLPEEMSEGDRFEVLYLVKMAMDIVQPEDVRGYRVKVKQKLDKALQDVTKSETELLREIVDILFAKKDQKHSKVLDEADGLDEPQDEGSRLQLAATYKTSGPTVIVDDVLDKINQSMCIGASLH